MRALRLHADRDLVAEDIAPPPPPGPGEIGLRVRAVALNHIDVWGFRGMAFARRRFPLTIGAEAVAEVVALGPDVQGFAQGDRVVPYAALVCGQCRACRAGRENLCEAPAGVRGFHIDGFATEFTNHPARLAVKVPPAVATEDAACVAVAYATVEHMLFDNAKLEPGETILVHAGGSGIGSIAVLIAKSLGCSVITTVGGAEKRRKAAALGADHVIDYQAERFEGVVRKLTARRGVDVVFEHTGADTWSGSLFSLCRGGRLVTCGATSGPAGSINLMQLFQQQYRIIGSFGSPLDATGRALDRIAGGIRPVIDSTYALCDIHRGLERLERRDVFGKIVVTF